MVLVPVSGCIGPSTYELVYVRGTEQTGGDACELPFHHELDRKDKRLAYAAFDNRLGNPDALVVFNHKDQGACPLERSIHEADDPVTGTMGGFGELAVEVLDDGTAIVTGPDEVRTVEPGDEARFSYDTTWETAQGTVDASASFLVENLGAYPQAGLEPRWR